MRILALLLSLLCLTSVVPQSAGAASYGAWLPYWVKDTPMEEAQTLGGNIDEAVAFACLFDKDDRLLMLREVRTLYSSLRNQFGDTDTAVFLSVVNDREVSEGKYENKSAALLWRLLGTDEAIDRHIDALVSLVDDYGLKGLEIDYENLKGDTALWERFVLFVDKLYKQCERDGVLLRVVLPWDAPRHAALPEGPEYSVMCYNLYGFHSGAGPKADYAFLRTTCELYQGVQGEVRMAFATGGFDWCDGNITALTQKSADMLLLGAGAQAQRDENSGVLRAEFTDDGQHHEVWYADATTLALWRDICREYGFEGFDLFCLGGNYIDDWEAELFTD